MLAPSPPPDAATVLVLTEIAPAPVSDGATRRTAALLDALGSRFRLVVLFLGPSGAMPASAAAYPDAEWHSAPQVPRFGARRLAAFGRPGARASFLLDHYLLGDRSRTTPDAGVRDAVARLLRTENIVGIVTRYLMPAWLAGPSFPVPMVADVDDDFAEWIVGRGADGLTRPQKMLTQWRNRLLLRRYRQILPRLEGAIFARADDAQRYRGVTRTFHGPNRFATARLSRSTAPGEPLRLGYLAGALTPANLEGARWLVSRVITPALQQEALRSRLRFVFAGQISGWVRDTFPALAESPAVAFMGPVAEAGEFYAAIDIATSPVFSGGGSSVKYFEALGQGVPVMATRFGARGDEALSPDGGLSANGELSPDGGLSRAGVFISDAPAAWLSELERLARDPAARAAAIAGAAAERARLGAEGDRFRAAVLAACAVFERDHPTRTAPERAAWERGSAARRTAR